MPRKQTLVDKKTQNLFGTSNSLDIKRLIRHLKKLDEELPKMIKDKPFFPEIEEEFIISNKPMNLNKLYKNFGKYFSNCINWKSEKTQFNITPPTTLSSVAGSSITNLLNPNAIWDVASGGFAKLERQISSFLGGLVNWKESPGIFVFGGTATNMYAIKAGLNQCQEDTSKKGVDKDVYVISNDEGHSCHVTICDWLGIGSERCIRLRTNKKGVVNSMVVLKKAEEIIKKGNKVACIILNGGTNFNGRIDPIKEVALGIDILVKKYKLTYRPHLHIDSVIGWVFLLFKEYDFNENPLKFPKKILKKIKSIYDKQKDIFYADSFGVDFHKTGFCSYLSSVFIVKDSNGLNILGGDKNLFTHQEFNFGEYKPGQFTLETSRPVSGAVSAYLTLNSLGITGIQKIIANLLYVSYDLKERIEKAEEFSNCNLDSDGWATLYLVKKEIHHPTFSELYEENNKNLILESNEFQKEFYDYLTKKYEGKLPWNIGFSKCYKKSKLGIPISTLKNYPMSPFNKIKHNGEFLNWLSKNLLEYKNEII